MAESTQAGAARLLRVLVVDDNRDHADSLCALMRFWGYDVRAAYDGAEALDAAVSFRPHCLFLDIGLPQIDGYELARRLRQHPALERAKLIALTAYSGQEHGTRAREAGFDHFLVKPAEVEEVERVLHMFDQVVRLASRTEELARETQALVGDTQGSLEEVREEIKEVKEEIQEVKEEIREVKEVVTGDRPDDPPRET